MVAARLDSSAPGAGARRDRRGAGVALVLALGGAGASCGASAPRATPTTSTTSPTTVPAVAAPGTQRTAAGASTTAPATTTTDPGLAPQTPDRPADGAALTARLQGLWRAITDGSVSEGRALFFPQSAYLQMKTGLLADPAGDFSNRLLGFYGLDIAAYHQLLGADAATARLVSVDAADADAAWIAPGQCENHIGYWHLPGVRLVYQVGPQVRSFAVDSLISWRGTWYVVHLGPNPRPQDVGTVDQPAAGPGGGCPCTRAGTGLSYVPADARNGSAESADSRCRRRHLLFRDEQYRFRNRQRQRRRRRHPLSRCPARLSGPYGFSDWIGSGGP